MIYDREQHVMSGSVAEPVRLPPRTNKSGRLGWMDFSHALTKMLRHTGSGSRNGHLRITDAAGWATTGDISRVAKANRRLAPLTININYMHGIVLDDEKGRFQFGVLVAEPDVPDPTKTLRVHAIYAMRA
eukprot:13935562-Heterocapsa_arctica.AAC.1